jgi:DNA-binding LytR/AlgR family response regulator
MNIKAIIVEDEQNSLERIKFLLKSYEEIVIIGDASDGETAVEIINRLKPDLIFLDIQLPVINGFEVIDRIKYRPMIVFTTAYDQYALKAFDVNGIDYLLKPISKEKLDRAIKRVLNNKININDNIFSAIKDIVKKKVYLKRFSIKGKDEILIIPQEDVCYFKAEDKYVFLCTIEKEYFYDATIKELEKMLDPEIFLRIHRSYIISIDKIKKIDKWFLGEYKVKLSGENETSLKISRSYLPKVRKILRF